MALRFVYCLIEHSIVFEFYKIMRIHTSVITEYIIIYSRSRRCQINSLYSQILLPSALLFRLLKIVVGSVAFPVRTVVARVVTRVELSTVVRLRAEIVVAG